MSLFANQRFLLKLHAQAFDLQIPRTTGQYEFSRPHFKFFCSHQTGFEVREDADIITLKVGDLALKGFELSWDNSNKKVQVVTDELNLYPLMALPASDGGLWLSNTTAYFPRVEPRYHLDPHAVQQFFTRQFLLPGHFFIKGVRRISGRWESSLPHAHLPAPADCHWSMERLGGLASEALCPERMAHVLREAFELILEKAQPEEFRMSGGADSRLISLLFEPGRQRGLRFRSAFASWSDKEQDLDYQVAKRWCDSQGWHLESQEFSEKHSSIFNGADGSTLLSGLYGGEFLGGSWEKALENPWEEPFGEYALTGYGESLIQEETAVLRKLSAADRKLLARQVFTHSDRSFIYHNVRSGWVSPLANFRVAVSPFAVVPFLKYFLRLRPSRFRDYNFFVQVLSILEGQKRHFPVCSALTHHHPRWRPPESWGYEVKSQLQSRPWSEAGFNRAMDEVMMDLLKRGVDLSEERFKKNLAASATFRRLATNFFFAFRRQAATT